MGGAGRWGGLRCDGDQLIQLKHGQANREEQQLGVRLARPGCLLFQLTNRPEISQQKSLFLLSKIFFTSKSHFLFLRSGKLWSPRLPLKSCAFIWTCFLSL